MADRQPNFFGRKIRSAAIQRHYDAAAARQPDFMGPIIPQADLAVRQPMLGNATNVTTAVQPVNPQAAQHTTNVTGAQTAQVSSFNERQHPLLLMADDGQARNFQAPDNYLTKSSEAIGQQMDARTATQQAYGNAYKYGTGEGGVDPTVLAESYRKQAMDNYRQTPGGESFYQRFARNPNLMISPMASKQMQLQKEQDAINPAQVIQQGYADGEYLRNERTGEVRRMSPDGYQVRRRLTNDQIGQEGLTFAEMKGAKAGGNTTPFRTRAEYALTGDAATQDQIDAFEQKKAAAIEARGGVKAGHDRRIRQRQETLSRAVRRGIISQREADQSLAGDIERAGGEAKNYLDPGGKFMKDHNKQRMTDAAEAAIAAASAGGGITGGNPGALPPRLPGQAQFDDTTRAKSLMAMNDAIKNPESRGALAAMGLVQPNADGEPSVNVTSFTDFTNVDSKVIRDIKQLSPAEQYTYSRSMATAMRAALTDNAKAFEDSAQTPGEKALIKELQSIDINDQEKINGWFFRLADARKNADKERRKSDAKMPVKATADFPYSTLP